MTQQQADPPTTPMTVRDVLLLALGSVLNVEMATFTPPVQKHIG